jgi:hypothetical protein
MGMGPTVHSHPIRLTCGDHYTMVSSGECSEFLVYLNKRNPYYTRFALSLGNSLLRVLQHRRWKPILEVSNRHVRLGDLPDCMESVFTGME